MFRRRQQRCARLDRAKHSSRHPMRRRKLAIEPLEDRRLLAAVTVNNNTDILNGNVTSIANLIAAPGADGISLREAIQAANADVAADTITFHAALNGGEILLNVAQGHLDITNPLTINASALGAGLTINGNDPSAAAGDGIRIFNVDNLAAGQIAVTLAGLTLTGGDVTGDGGAILSVENLTVSNSVITGNAATANGGGITHRTGNLAINFTTFSNNAAGTNGGGLYAFYANNVAITNSSFSGNTAANDGGGVYLKYSNVASISGTTISGNMATADGGGIYLDSNSAATIISSTISGNTANGEGGGIFADVNAGQTLAIRHSTITGNTSDNDAAGGGAGGGIYFDSGTGAVTLNHTIVAANTDNLNFADDLDNTSAVGANPTLTASFNLIGDGTNSGITNGVMGNQVGNFIFAIDPELFALADNGGPTLTHLPMPGSPVIDKGNPAAFAGVGTVPVFDQRGEPYLRIQDGDGGTTVIDIGAVEVEDPDNGPRVVDLFITHNEPYQLFDPKPSTDGPTPLAHSLTIRVQGAEPNLAQPLFGDYNDDGVVDAADYVVFKKFKGTNAILPNDAFAGTTIDDDQYNQWKTNFGSVGGVVVDVVPAVNLATAMNKSNYQLVGDFSGNVAIAKVEVVLGPMILGQPSIADIRLVFNKPLADDRYTLTVSDSIRDVDGNPLDGDSDASQPLELPTFPSGDGFAGGDFVARFTIDSRPEIGSWINQNINVDINGNRTWDPAPAQIGGDETNIDLSFTLPVNNADGSTGSGGFNAPDQLFTGKFVNSLLGATGASRLFEQLAAYGNPSGGHRWIIDTNHDGVVTKGTDIVTTQVALPAGSNFNVVGANPLAGNFNLATPGDEIGLYAAGKWALDTNGNFTIDAADQFITGTLLGAPIVGDFDGDGLDDLAVFNNNNNTWSFDLAFDGLGVTNSVLGAADANGDVDQTLFWGFPGPLDKPLAADMDQDGIDDIGLFVPVASNPSQWHFLVSNTRTAALSNVVSASQFTSTSLIGATINPGDLVRVTGGANFPVSGIVQSFNSITGEITLTADLPQLPIIGNIVAIGGSAGSISTLNHGFSPTPLGNDYFAQFGNQTQMPFVGNLDPPVTAGGAGAAAMSEQADDAAATPLVDLQTQSGGSATRKALTETLLADAALADLRLVLLDRDAKPTDFGSSWPVNELEDPLNGDTFDDGTALEIAWAELGAALLTN